MARWSSLWPYGSAICCTATRIRLAALPHRELCEAAYQLVDHGLRNARERASSPHGHKRHGGTEKEWPCYNVTGDTWHSPSNERTHMVPCVISSHLHVDRDLTDLVESISCRGAANVGEESDLLVWCHVAVESYVIVSLSSW